MAVEREQVIEYIKGLSVLELAELVKDLEDELGVSATQPVVQGVVPPPDYEEQLEVEQTEFSVKLLAAGAKKVQTIKAMREVDKALGLKEAKEVVESAPVTVLEGVSKEEAEGARAKLAETGAQVEVL